MHLPDPKLRCVEDNFGFALSLPFTFQCSLGTKLKTPGDAVVEFEHTICVVPSTLMLSTAEQPNRIRPIGSGKKLRRSLIAEDKRLK